MVQICVNYLTKWGLPMSCDVKLLISSNILVVILFLILLLHSDSILIKVEIGSSLRVVITLPFRSSFSLLLLKCDIISVLIQDWMGKKEVLITSPQKHQNIILNLSLLPFFHHSHFVLFTPLILLQMWSILYVCIHIGRRTFPSNKWRPYGSI